MPLHAKAQEAPAAPSNEPQVFDIPAGPLKAALDRWAAQSRRELIYAADDIAEARTRGFKGRSAPMSALSLILIDSGFNTRIDPSGVIAITRRKPNASDLGATPEILVQGRRDWSLNLGVERTENDSQPFIVMTQEEIKRSGAPDLETFLRNQLTVNSTAGTSRQAGLDGGIGGNRLDRVNRGLSQVNLRGMGSRETLILVDGRRQPGVNLGNGTFGQTQISGIPLASIERIEVLASSASAIYGSGATGGAINIILKRAYSGGEITATYGNTEDFAAGEKRVDLSYARTLEGGRTNISFSGSWRQSDPLLYRDRIGIRDKNVAESVRLTGDSGLSAFAFQPPSAATPNIRSTTGRPLQLKPQYGGAVLSSAIGHIPEGYRGLQEDGLAPLLANIGQYNLDAPPGVQAGGLDAPLIYGTKLMNGLLTVRREMTDWMSLYLQGQASRTVSSTLVSSGFVNTIVSRLSPANPFTTDLNVSIPSVGTSRLARNELTQWSAVGGGIFKLPYEWQANLDVSYSRSRYKVPDFPGGVTPAFTTGVRNGSINILRDVVDYPLDYQFIENAAFRNSPVTSSNLMTSLRTSGPLPATLPGGKMQLTLNIERSQDNLGAAVSSESLFNAVSYQPPGRYTLWSGYGEVVFPLIGPKNGVPLVELFDIRVSARHERYTAFGVDLPVLCYQDPFVPPTDAVYDNCPPTGWLDRRTRSSRSATTPMVSFRWQPVQDVMFRGSYGTGYLPPTLAQITREPGAISVALYDPLRGNEIVGTPDMFGDYTVQGFSGGNPDIAPERSRTFTAGVIVTPRFLPNLRFSADWTRISKKNNFFSPITLALAGISGPDDPRLQEFAAFIAAYPDRVIRGQPSGGFAVGPITSLDFSLANYIGTTVEAVDFSLDYWMDFLGGRLDLSGSATWNTKLDVEAYPGQITDFLGTGGGASSIAGGNGALKWRANGTVRWSKDAFMIGLQTIYFDKYYLNPLRTLVPIQGSAYVPSQTYHNAIFSYAFDLGITLRGTINNILDKTPPRDTTVRPLFYSRFGDPLGRNFQISLSKTF